MEISSVFTGQDSFAVIAVFYKLLSYKIVQLKVQTPLKAENPEGCARQHLIFH